MKTEKVFASKNSFFTQVLGKLILYWFDFILNYLNLE